MAVRKVRCAHSDNISKCSDCWSKFSGDTAPNTPLETAGGEEEELQELEKTIEPSLDKLLDEIATITFLVQDSQLDPVPATVRLVKAITARDAKRERAAYKQGWDSAGGELVGVKQDIADQLIAARLDELNLLGSSTSFTSPRLADRMNIYLSDRIAALEQEGKNE